MINSNSSNPSTSPTIPFRKMHGLGNDFVIIDNRALAYSLSPALITLMADRQRGVGCDQLIILTPSARAAVFMTIYNPDGSESGACGNATRCVADIIMNEMNVGGVSIETVAGILNCVRNADGLISVNMGAPKDVQTDRMVQNFNGTIVDMGNPHFVVMVDDAVQFDVTGFGSKLEIDPAFPNRSNIEFVQKISDNHVRMRVWERGAGMTQACGSGACAVAVACAKNNLTSLPLTVTMDGGDLIIDYGDTVIMTGPVSHVFEGVFKGELP